MINDHQVAARLGPGLFRKAQDQRQVLVKAPQRGRFSVVFLGRLGGILG